MIIITEPSATEEQIEQIVARVQEFGSGSAGQPRRLARHRRRDRAGTDGLREKPLASMPGVEAIVPAAEPYKLAAFASRAALPRRSIFAASASAAIQPSR